MSSHASTTTNPPPSLGSSLIAAALSDHPRVVAVHHPSLPDHPDHARAARLFDGFGTMVAVDLGTLEAAHAFVEHLELPLHAPSLGGVESLVTLPAESSHATLTPEERAAVGVGDGLVRLSVGIEDADDLVADCVHALGHVPPEGT